MRSPKVADVAIYHLPWDKPQFPAIGHNGHETGQWVSAWNFLRNGRELIMFSTNFRHTANLLGELRQLNNLRYCLKDAPMKVTVRLDPFFQGFPSPDVISTIDPKYSIDLNSTFTLLWVVGSSLGSSYTTQLNSVYGGDGYEALEAWFGLFNIGLRWGSKLIPIIPGSKSLP